MVPTWLHKYRNEIAVALDAITNALSFVGLFATRVLGGSGVMLAYSVFNASPDITVYQLSQVTHLWIFWKGALLLAIIYSGMQMALNGAFSDRNIVRGQFSEKAAIEWKKEGVKDHEI
jgi:hypothetical protein